MLDNQGTHKPGVREAYELVRAELHSIQSRSMGPGQEVSTLITVWWGFLPPLWSLTYEGPTGLWNVESELYMCQSIIVVPLGKEEA